MLPAFGPEVPGLAVSGPLPAVDRTEQRPRKEEIDAWAGAPAPDGSEAASEDWGWGEDRRRVGLSWPARGGSAEDGGHW